MTWSQTWSGNFLEKTPADMWKKNLDDDRIIALDDMPGWDKVIAGTTPIHAAVANKLAISVSGKTLNLNMSSAAPASIALFDMLGHKMATLAKGNLAAGSLQFSLDGIASGNYIVRAKIGTANYAKKITYSAQ